jgi:hypothetical protein
MQQQQGNNTNVCARCCQPMVDLTQARFNRVFWGMAHKKCTEAKVWPPAFRPSLDPNEVMRQISALCTHLAKLSTGLPIPQIIPNPAGATQPMSPPSPRPVQQEVSREEKTSAAAVTSMGGNKRRQHPPATPKATPPPRPKEARQDGTPDAISQARRQSTISQQQSVSDNQPQPATPVPSNNQQPFTSDNKQQTTNHKPQTTNRGRRDSLTLTNQNTLREYKLQIKVRDMGGKTHVQDSAQQWGNQRRTKNAYGEEIQWASVPDHECSVVALDLWHHWKDFDCVRCKKKWLRPQDAQPDAIRGWSCDGCRTGFDICMECVPVVLRTEIVDFSELFK